MIINKDMNVLILKNIPSEGPGTIEDFLLEKGIAYTTVDLTAEAFPRTTDADTLVIMGGPMSVNEAEIYPDISQEEDLVRDFIAKGKKILGICLGAQIIAKALGSRVYPGSRKEIGWYDIELLGEGLRDSVIRKAAMHPAAGDFWKKFRVFHWHGETFDIPIGADRLARSDLYPNQAFKYGSGVYAFQFHLEVTKEMIMEWLGNEPVDMEKVRRDTEAFYADYSGRARNFYKAFFTGNNAAEMKARGGEI